MNSARALQDDLQLGTGDQQSETDFLRVAWGSDILQFIHQVAPQTARELCDALV